MAIMTPNEIQRTSPRQHIELEDIELLEHQLEGWRDAYSKMEMRLERANAKTNIYMILAIGGWGSTFALLALFIWRTGG